MAKFDDYSDNYDAVLAESQRVTGEDKHYFAHGRIEWLARRLRALGKSVDTVLDFGCGTGTAIPYLHELLGPELVWGVDVSEQSLRTAERDFGSECTRFQGLEDFDPAGDLDLVYVNGVFHHLALDERPAALDAIRRSLRPDGLFALWENNPWNPGTRYMMDKCSFDDDALPINPRTARAMVRSAGFEVIRTDFLFIFPRVLRGLRPLEPMLATLPLGGQYMVLCRVRKKEDFRRNSC